MRKGAPQVMQELSEIGASLPLVGVWPQKKRQMLARLQRIAVQNQIAKERFEAIRADRGDDFAPLRDPEFPEQFDAECGSTRSFACNRSVLGSHCERLSVFMLGPQNLPVQPRRSQTGPPRSASTQHRGQMAFGPPPTRRVALLFLIPYRVIVRLISEA